MGQILSYTWYPALMAGSCAGFAAMLDAGFSPLWSASLPVALIAVAVLVLEAYFPERKPWLPRRADVLTDTAFLAVVQVALPRVLVAASVLIAAETPQREPSPWWPDFWPLIPQILTMVLAVDLARYWLHRACHRCALLWKFHKIHHSPEILYALNSGRFHPVEKALQFAVEMLPFVLLGVAPEVIAGYFLVYSTNGLLQHSNIRLRCGWLNYLVAGPETHRWHHAREPRVAACNYGSTTTVWDVIFDTWYLPEDRAVGDVGLLNRSYPKSFLAQLRRPFADFRLAPLLRTRMGGHRSH